jgi:N,N'-diacetylchitobiose phosphorylase
LSGYDTRRDAFLGTYRSYDRPLAVEQGACSNSDAYGDNACGVLQCELELAPGETRDLLVLLGIGSAERAGQETMAEYGNVARAGEELARLKAAWHSKLGNLVVETPDENLNHMLNVWGPYNALVTFNWSRAASLVYNGERNGLGFRDSVQDVLGILTADPDAARGRLELMLTGQLANGGAMPVVKPFDHHPGVSRAPVMNTSARMTACGSSMPSRRMWRRAAILTSTKRCCRMLTRAKIPCLDICAGRWSSTWNAPANMACHAAWKPIGMTA